MTWRWAITLCLAWMVPHAAGLTVEPGEVPTLPAQGSAEVPFTITVPCSTMQERQGHTVAHMHYWPGILQATGAEEVSISADVCPPGGVARANGSVVIYTDEGDRADAPASVIIRADLAKDGLGRGAASASAVVPVQLAPSFATTGRVYAVEHDGHHKVSASLRNLGNLDVVWAWGEADLPPGVTFEPDETTAGPYRGTGSLTGVLDGWRPGDDVTLRVVTQGAGVEAPAIEFRPHVVAPRGEAPVPFALVPIVLAIVLRRG